MKRSLSVPDKMHHILLPFIQQYTKIKNLLLDGSIKHAKKLELQKMKMTT